MTLNVQNFHRWLTHMAAVACDILSQSCQLLFTSNSDQIN